MKNTQPKPEWTLGIDLGDRRANYCWLDSSGQKAGEGTVALTAQALADLVGRRKARTRVAFEVG